MANIKDQLNDQLITAKALLNLMHLAFTDNDFTLFNHAIELTKYNRLDTRIGWSIDEIFYELIRDSENALEILAFLDNQTNLKQFLDKKNELQVMIESKYGKKKENPYANLY